MKKLGLFFGMAAFMAAGMLFWGCDKMGNDELNLPPGLIAKNSKLIMIMSGATNDCSGCIVPGGPYVEKPDKTKVTWGGPKNDKFNKTVDIIVYNTESNFILKVRSTEGFSDLVIDNVSSWTEGPVAANVWGVKELDLPADWVACQDCNFVLQVAGNGPPAVFNVEYKLVEVCKGCVIRTESAWADGSRYVEQGNWATYTEFDFNGAKTVNIFAGKDQKIGTVTLRMASYTDDDGAAQYFQDLSFDLVSGWTLRDIEENVKIEGYDETPSGNPAPGQFKLYKESLGGLNSWGISFGIEEHWKYFGIHLDVEICE